MDFEESDPLIGRRRVKSTTRKVTTAFLVVLALVVVGLVLALVIPPFYGSDEPDPAPLRAAGDSGEDIVIETANGKVRGGVLQSREGREYYGFWGIPYAEPPLGKLRFQPPLKLQTKWEGVRDASVRLGAESECVQNKRSKINGVEDCLKLHVMTPNLPRRRRFFRLTRKFPVMFYIFGGAFEFGRSTRYSAEYFMDEDVVVVFTEFRQGAFGYLNTEDTVIRGNMAFKDQALALRWVRDNIEKFGGDPDCITIFGNSSGGLSVHALMLSSMTNALFHRGISQSGSIIPDPGLRNRSIEVARQLGRDLNCTDVQNTRALHECLIQADPYDIAAIDLLDFLPLTEETIPEDGDMSDVFMPDYPFEVLHSGNFSKIPWILGGNSGETYAAANIILKSPEIVKSLNENWSDTIDDIVHFVDDENKTASTALKQYYFGDKPISNETRLNLTNVLSDAQWIHPLKRAADIHCKSGSKIYFYWMSHEPAFSYGSFSTQGFTPPYGAAHADEVQFLFPYDPNPYIGKNSTDYQFSKKMIKTWVSFAKNGIPRVPGGPRWPPLDSKDPNKSKWMELNDTARLIPVPDRLKFLDTFPLMYSR